jgi:hypothetical protein
MKVGHMFRLRDRRGEATETREGGFGIIIADTRGHVLSPYLGQTRRWAVNKIGPKDRYDQLVNRLLRGRLEGQIGHVSSIIR